MSDPGAPHPPTPLRLASYNIQKAVGLDMRRNPGRVIDAINALGADVVALQEADRRFGDRAAAIPRDLIAAHTDFTVADLARSPVSLGWHGNAMLVRRSLRILDAHHIELPGLEPRGAVQVDLDTPSGPLHVLGTHLGLLRSWRRKQLARIRGHLDAHDLDRTVVMGDFNEWSTQHGLELLEAAFDVIAPGRSFHAARPVAALDRIALGHGLVSTGAGVLSDGPAAHASDHLPVWADLVPKTVQSPDDRCAPGEATAAEANRSP